MDASQNKLGYFYCFVYYRYLLGEIGGKILLSYDFISVPTTAVSARSGSGDNEGVSQSTLILIICAAIGGLVLLVVLLVFILTRFYR